MCNLYSFIVNYYFLLLLLISTTLLTLRNVIFSLWLRPLHPTRFFTDTPPTRKLGAYRKCQFPTRNNDFVVAFMCIQLVNMIWRLEHDMDMT